MAPDPNAAVTKIVRNDRGRLLAILTRELRDLDLAEESFSEATVSAIEHWGRNGVPMRPQAWLLQVARRKAIDRIRKNKRFEERRPELETLMERDADASEADVDEIPDSRMRLIFACCHPVLEPKTQVALTLRTICGLTTQEIAQAFLDKPSAMGQRLSRAKAKIAETGAGYSIPVRDEWPERLNSVLNVIYLIFNEGYLASSGEAPLRIDLCDEAIFLARLINKLAPEEAEIEGLLALILLTHGRAGARTDAAGRLVDLDAQDSELWDQAMIDEGIEVLDRAIARLKAGPFQIKAAIHAVHVDPKRSGPPDWRQIVLLYDSLLIFEDSPVVRLNRAVALAETGAVSEAFVQIDALSDTLAAYQPYHAARAEMLARLGKDGEATAAYQKAIEMAQTSAQRAFLRERQKKGPSTKLGLSPTGR